MRGFVDGGVFTFKGIPYGQDTGGENRWLPAKPPTPWKDEYPALIYGPNCPQNLHDFTAIEQSFLQDWDDGYMSEDMLKLNIWTPSLTGKRPVMVYFHGGGFSFGSSYELPSHEGAQMARHHDVVQVSVNHRLNALGFLDVSEIGGSAYEDSANVGMTDLVAALWVQDNIANFGGDPDRVMIYGQSGGGSKVTSLMGMPSAAGLFHRASRAIGRRRQIRRRRTVEGICAPDDEGAGIGPNDIAALQKMEWSRAICRRQGVAVANESACRRASGGPAAAGGPPRVGWAPTMDGNVMHMRPFYDAAPEVSKNIPLLIGSVSEEGYALSFQPDEAEWQATLSRTYGEEKANGLIARHEEGASRKRACARLSYGVSGLAVRNNVSSIWRS